MTDKHASKASDIMDEACLGEPFVSNGVVAALRASIESALRSAAAEEREECAAIADYFSEDGYLDSNTCDTVASSIRSRGNSNE